MLFEEEILLALPADHPMAEREHLKLVDVLEEDFICLNENWALGDDCAEKSRPGGEASGGSRVGGQSEPDAGSAQKRPGDGPGSAVSWKGFGEDFVG